MNFFEQSFTLGENMPYVQNIALYKYLLESKRKLYISDARELFQTNKLIREIANGEISYAMNGRVVSYSARRKGASGYMENIRTIKLAKIPKFRTRKAIKFFAQCEVDVINNCPIQSDAADQYTGFSIIRYTFFDPRYFANGRSCIWGVIPMLRNTDAQMMKLLRDPNSTGWERHWTSNEEG